MLRFMNFFVSAVENELNDSYGSHSTATPIILHTNDFSNYNTSQASPYATTEYSNKVIQTSLPSIDLGGDEDNFIRSETESDNRSSFNQEDIIYIRAVTGTKNGTEYSLSDNRPEFE